MATVDISAGTLPPPACYASEQDRLDAYAAALIGNLNSGAEWAASQTAPGNSGLYWLRTDISNRPVEVLKFSSAAGDSQFIRLSSEVVFAGTASGAAGAYAVINSPPYPSPASAYRAGQIYTFLANHTNAGACTLNVDGQGAKAITKDGTAALTANDILIGQVVSVLYDGVNFQLITQKRDLTRQSLRQFLTYESATVAINTAGVFQAFNHLFKNDVTLAPVIPATVRVVLKKISADPPDIFTNTISPSITFPWYLGQEVDCLNLFASAGAPYSTSIPAFKYLVDTTQINVQTTYQNGIILPGMLPILTPANYQLKVYATAYNPLFVFP